MSDTPHTRRSAWPLIVGFAVLAVLIAAAGYWAWRQQTQSLQRQAERSLVAVGELKAGQITSWLKETQDNAEMIRGDPLLSAAVADMLGGRDAGSATTSVQTYLDNYQRNYGYKDVVMTSPKGAVLLSAPKAASGPLDGETRILVAKAAATGRVESSGLYQDAEGNALLELAAPVLEADGGAIAVVILRSDLDHVLYPLIQRWPLPSKSGETLLVERRADRVVYLNELRHRKNTAFKLTVPLSKTDLPAVMAVRGRRGIAPGVDYRGVPVLAAVQPVPGTPWFIVAKEDTAEVLGPIRTRGWLTAGFTLLLVLLAGVGTLFLWRSRESQASAEILESEGKFRTLFENMTEGVALHELVVDAGGAPLDYRILDLNPAYEAQTGVSAAQARGKLSGDAYGTAEPPFLAEYARAAQSGEPHRFETYFEPLARHFDITAVAQGEGRFATVFEDITERRQAEEALRAASLHSRNLIETSLDPMITISAEGKITDVNTATEKVTGKSRETLIDSDFADYFTEPEMARAGYQKAFSAGQVIDYPLAIRHSSGAITEVLYNASVYRDEHGEVLGVFAAARDITELRRSELELRQIKAAVDSASDAIGISTSEGRHIYQNKAFDRLFGYTKEEISSTGAAILHADGATGTRVFEAIMAGESCQGESEMVAKDGRHFPVAFRADAFKDENGKILGLIGAHTDITERKRAEDEVRRLNAELEQRVLDRTAQLDAANKELEAFAYSVSHDLRAPLRHISGFSELLAARSADVLDDRGRHYLETITASVREMGVLIDDLLQFSRTGRAELQISKVNMEHALREALEPLQRDTEGRDIEWSIGPLPAVIGDHALLRQVWANLLGNAAKYSRGRTPARIEVGVRDSDGEREDVFYVRDNGVGFDMQYAHKLFGVFQRLHSAAEFEGTGIGLANVQRIIDRLGGRVWAEAELDSGATFYFSLPRRKETPP